ncbi:hypothetical protein GEMRC1_001271 [Eukaryota sp. GEM-RC1]
MTSNTSSQRDDSSKPLEASTKDSISDPHHYLAQLREHLDDYKSKIEEHQTSVENELRLTKQKKRIFEYLFYMFLVAIVAYAFYIGKVFRNSTMQQWRPS